MARPHQPWPRIRLVGSVLLVCAQLVSLIGFPAIVPSAAQRTRCGGAACGCRTEADRQSSACCCSTPAKIVRLAPVESCCSKPGAKNCCAKPKPNGKPEVTWVVGLFARSCKGTATTGWIAAEPAVPPTEPSAVPFPPLSKPILVARFAPPPVLPSVPPDPPPRFPV